MEVERIQCLGWSSYCFSVWLMVTFAMHVVYAPIFMLISIDNTNKNKIYLWSVGYQLIHSPFVRHAPFNRIDQLTFRQQNYIFTCNFTTTKIYRQHRSFGPLSAKKRTKIFFYTKLDKTLLQTQTSFRKTEQNAAPAILMIRHNKGLISKFKTSMSSTIAFA